MYVFMQGEITVYVLSLSIILRKVQIHLIWFISFSYIFNSEKTFVYLGLSRKKKNKFRYCVTIKQYTMSSR